jgi:hypothetical protein
MNSIPMVPSLSPALTPEDAPARPAPDVEALRRAHDRTVDAAAGFETMVAKAEPQFRPVAERFLDLHRRHALAIAGMLRTCGVEPDADGTLFGTVNRVVLAARAFIDEDVMANVRRGEASVLEAYEDAARAGLADRDREAMRGLHAELSALLAETRHQG